MSRLVWLTVPSSTRERSSRVHIAVLEAAATNLPLILTRVAGNSDFASFGLSHIFWAPPENADALGRAIEQWICSAPHRPNHRVLTGKLFDADVCLSRVLQAYEGVADRRAH